MTLMESRERGERERERVGNKKEVRESERERNNRRKKKQ